MKCYHSPDEKATLTVHSKIRDESTKEELEDSELPDIPDRVL